MTEAPRISVRLRALLLAVFVAACSSQTGEADDAKGPSWTAVSDTGAFTVTIAPRQTPTPIGQYHEWTVRVADAGGRAVYPARIGLSGGMPGHGHGLPTQPQVTEHLGDGLYRAEGMMFNMTGQWVLVLRIQNADTTDRVEFDIELTI